MSDIINQVIYDLEAKKLAELKRITEIDQEIAKLRGGETPPEKPKDLSDFLAEDDGPVQWVIDGMLPVGSVGMLTAVGGVGKTTLAVQWTLCMALGRPCFKFNHTTPSRVLYLIAEGARTAFRQRVRTTMGSLGIDKNVDAFEGWCIQPKNVDDFSIGGRYLEPMIAASRPRVVILDTLGYFFRGDENSNTEWKQGCMVPLRALGEKYGCAFLVVHHHGKENPWRKNSEKSRGASAMQGDCDLMLRLEQPNVSDEDPDPPERILYVDKNKYGRGHYYRRLLFDPERAIFRSQG